MTKKLSQQDVASFLKVCTDSITGWENGRSIPHISYYKDLISFIGYYPFTNESDSLAGKILKYRQTNGLTHRQMGRKLGVNASTIAAWEAGENEPQERFLKKIQEVLAIVLGQEVNKPAIDP